MDKKVKGLNGPVLNAYPDSVGGNLESMVELLENKALENVFDGFYILPSVFNTDLDRGFSIIDYSINKEIASEDAIEKLKKANIRLKLDFVLNHLSVLSSQFQDILKNGKKSKYADFFIDWNKFWEGKGQMTEAGFIQPDEKYIEKMFFRKPGLPILMVRMPDGTEVPYWNTFYQEVKYPTIEPEDVMKSCNVQYLMAQRISELINSEIKNGKTPKEISFGKYEKYKNEVVEYLDSKRTYLGQMDLNINSPLVWEYYDETLKTLAKYGASIVRLDAFAYAPKEAGEKNFLNEPGTWELLKKVQNLADKYGVTLLPEIHASYSEKIYKTLSEKGYMVYDFFLPGILIDAIESGTGDTLVKWANEIYGNNMKTVNMLGCHDGIPLLDLKGLIPDERIEELIEIIVGRGGYVKNLHGQKNMYYQVNATYFSALGEDEDKLLLARAIQVFMPGIPQVWYLDLFAGSNDYEAVKRAGAGGHKEINRSNLSKEQAIDTLNNKVVAKQIELLRFRKTHRAFAEGAKMSICADGNLLKIRWTNDNDYAELNADLSRHMFTINASNMEEL